MQFRIKKYDEGFVVEVQKKTWYGKTYWTHFISVAGIASKPWYHSTYNDAESNLIKTIKWDTIWNSR